MSASPELLMPAGDLDKLKYAFAYGADAVYAGVPIYSLRARENGFDIDALREGIEYAHARGKRVYLTMNIYAHNSKINRFMDSFCEMSELNSDGFIMTDAGLIREALKLRPDTVIHLSTQANVTNWMTAKFWRDQGVRRIILSRELSIKEIAKIHEEVPDIELEAFVHGSICIAYSGRCLISNYLNHRDANQGTCTNSCRWNYRMFVDGGSLQQTEAPAEDYQSLYGHYYVAEKTRAEKSLSHRSFENDLFEIDEDEHGTYLMNSKDLCAIELLKDLVDAGVCSLKVEGRTKSLYYAAIISRVYRNAIDEMMQGKEFDQALLAEAASTSNRTLMTGFLLKRPREYGMNYDDGESKPLSHRYAARVLEYDANTNTALVEFKNKVVLGESLEWITPESTEEHTIEAIEKPNGKSVDSAHGGCIYRIPVPMPVNEFTLLRQKIEQGD
jgi:putative protease